MRSRTASAIVASPMTFGQCSTGICEAIRTDFRPWRPLHRSTLDPRLSARGPPRRTPGAFRAPGPGLRRLAETTARPRLAQVPPRREARLYRPPLGRPPALPRRRPRRDGQQCRRENLARPIALPRKNALFAGHDEGAAAWGRIASLIETAKLNQIEPYAWLKDTLEKIAAGHPNSRIDELLPWNFMPPSS